MYIEDLSYRADVRCVTGDGLSYGYFQLGRRHRIQDRQQPETTLPMFAPRETTGAGKSGAKNGA